MLFRGVYLAARKRRIGFVTLLANWCFALGSLSPCECLSSSTLPLIMGCSALLSVVSQLLSVCNPADSLVRLQRGATPVAACLQAPAELCKAVAAASQTFGNRLSVFPDRQNIIVLVGGVVLPPPHAALGTDRLARRPSCKACQKSATLPLAKKVPYVTRPASCSHSGMFAVTVARRHRIPFSIFSVNVITPSPSCRLWSISACRAKRHAERIERIINAFVPRKALRRPHADFGAGQRQDFPAA